MKTWQCVLLSVAVHGVIFGFRSCRTQPDLHTEEIQLLVLEPPPMDFPVEKIPEPVAAPNRPNRQNADPPSKQAKREPPAPRKKPVPVPKPVLAAPDPKARRIPISFQTNHWKWRMNPRRHLRLRKVYLPDHRHPTIQPPIPEEEMPGVMDHAVESSVGAMGGPQFIQRSVPKYPRMAQRLGVEGSVLLRLAIDASGKLTGLRWSTVRGTDLMKKRFRR